MRPASSRGITLWITALCLLATFLSLEGLTSAQAAPVSKRKLSQAAQLNAPAVASMAAARRATPNAQSKVTTDTWTGGGGANNNWSDASNWNNGAITTGENILINLTTAATNEDDSASIGTLTLSNAGDSVSIANGTSLTVAGNVANNGTIALSSGGSGTNLVIGASAVTLSGTGTLTLSNNSNNAIVGAAATDVFTNAQTIQGSGNIGDNKMALVNSGTINATQSTPLYIQTSNGTTNTGTLEATTGTLILYGNTITQTGAGNISSTGSDVQLQNGVTIIGGTLKTSGAGLIHTTGGQVGTLQNLTNAGNYQLDNGSDTNLIGTITNNGNINLASGGSSTELIMNGNVTLAGTGTVTMSNNSNNTIIGAAAADVLTVGSGQTISGAGNIGFAQMALVNNGTINATQTNPLYIQTSNGTTNNSILEATGGGTLILYGPDTITNTSGTITAATGSTVSLQHGTIINGGTLNTSGTGLIHTQAGQASTLENLTNAGNYQIDNDAVNTFIGTITNNGNINMDSGGSSTELQLSGNVTLSGTGTLTLSNNTNNLIFGVSGTEVLTNNINISGSGNIGFGSMVLNNTSLGTINANQSNTLTIDPSAGGVTNTGLLEATAGGTLALDSGTYTNKVGSTSGTILANGGTVDLNAGADIVGGTLKSENGGVIQNTNTATLDGSTSTGAVTLVAGSSLVINNGTALSVKGSIVNNGTITMNSGGSTTEFEIAGPSGANVTLSGSGTLVLSNNTNNIIFGAADANTLTNQETIQGSGNLGDGQMAFVNQGTVNANQSNTLTIQTSNGTTNTGTLEATTGGTLLLLGNTFTNTGGKIQAIGASGSGNGAVVNLENGTSITGGTITSNQFGSFNVLNNATLSGLTSNATVNINNGTVLDLVGTIVNNGTIAENSGGSTTELTLTGNVALNGTGVVTMSNNSNNYIFGGAGTDVLTVASTQTIQGAGNIGDNQMVLVNNGTINANQSNVLYIQTSGGTTNNATLEATGGGSLSLFGNTVTNTGAGTITAASGSTVFLQGGVTVKGGSLNGPGTFVENGVSGGATLSGLTNNSTVQIGNGTVFTLVGAIVNNGSIQENSSGSTTEIQLSGNVTLSGTGALVMSNNSNNYLFGVSGSDVLTNASTIEGAGHLGDGQMGLVNSGSIIANDSNTLSLSVSGTVSNSGIFESTSSGGLVVTAPTNSFLNYNGTSNTLTGGTYIANGGNITLPLGSSGGITTLAANVTEEAGGQILNGNNANANALNGLTSITSAGALTIGGVAFTDPGAFSNAGSLTILSGESFKVGSLTQISGGTLTAGTYVLDANLNLTGATQNITTNAANLTLAGGTIENANSTNALANLATNSGKLTLAGGATFSTVGNFSNTGTLTLNGPSDTFTVNGTLAQISGTTLSGGTFVLGGNLDLTTTGINITTNSSTLTLDGGTIMSGAANALTNLAVNTKSLTLAGNANFTTTGNFTNTGALTINSGSTFTVLHGSSLTNYHNTGSAANALVSGSYTVAGTLAFDAGTTGAIKTDAASITLEGSGNFLNTSTGAPSTNALLNLNAISTTGAFTLADNANFTAIGNFTNNGKLTVDSGSTFALTGSNVLTNLASGTLGSGTYTVGGTLQLTSANGGITSNAASLTLSGSTAKILDGTSNALAGFNNNSGTFVLSGGAGIASASSNFTNTGTVDIAKASILDVPGAGHSYSQTAGQTTVDGTLEGINGGAIITGGTILGAGTIKGNLTAGNASGTAVTVNVGDSGKAGLLSITGTYTQLATGNLTGLISGTSPGVSASLLKVTGSAALAGTINYSVATAFQASLTVGETFTALTASTLNGTTFSNSTIAINGSLHFNVSYTATSVVLTVASGAASTPSSNPARSGATIALASAKPTTAAMAKNNTITLSGRGLSGVIKSAKPFEVASWSPAARSGAILARGADGMSGTRPWERVPVMSAGEARPITIAARPIVAHPITIAEHAPEAESLRMTPATSDLRMGAMHALGMQSPVRMNTSNMSPAGNRRVDLRPVSPLLPRAGR